MATQAINNQVTQVVEGQAESLWDKMRNFVSPVTDLIDMSVNSYKAIDYLGNDCRANLPCRQRSQLNADLMGVHTN